MAQRTIEQKQKHAAYMVEYYKKNPEKKAAWKDWFRKHRKFNIGYNAKFRRPLIEKLEAKHKSYNAWYEGKKEAPCTDCNGWFDSWAMHYDHRDSSTKVANVSMLVKTGRPFKMILEEIAKCDLVCANCHATREHKRHTKEF